MQSIIYLNKEYATKVFLWSLLWFGEEPKFKEHKEYKSSSTKILTHLKTRGHFKQVTNYKHLIMTKRGKISLLGCYYTIFQKQQEKPGLADLDRFIQSVIGSQLRVWFAVIPHGHIKHH